MLKSMFRFVDGILSRGATTLSSIVRYALSYTASYTASRSYVVVFADEVGTVTFSNGNGRFVSDPADAYIFSDVVDASYEASQLSIAIALTGLDVNLRQCSEPYMVRESAIVWVDEVVNVDAFKQRDVNVN